MIGLDGGCCDKKCSDIFAKVILLVFILTPRCDNILF